MKSDVSKVFPYIAIVSLVAIVGIVVLVWSVKGTQIMVGKESLEMSDNSALAGEAVASCTDSDPTDDPFVFGQVLRNGRHTHADTCSGTSLTQYRCQATTVQRVIYRGGARTYSCPNGCSNGVCQAAQVCTPGSSRCTFNAREQCSTAGTAWIVSSCPTGQTCSGAGVCS